MPRRLTAGTCFAVLALLGELTGRAITNRLDGAFNVAPLATPTTRYYPFLLAGVRICAALVVAAVAIRLLRAHASASAAERLLGRIGRRPRFRVVLTLRLWGYAFAATSVWYLVQTDVLHFETGRWSLFAPWLHTYALPVFAACSLLLALAWGAVRGFVADVERYAEATFARASRLLRAAAVPVRRLAAGEERAPRRLHGVTFESRPPPLTA